jgi:DNA-binding NtrC family response regulator
MPGIHKDDGRTAARRDEPKGRILVVDDDSDVRDLVVEALTDYGYNVVTAVDGRAALEVLGTAENIDLLFTDLVMPGGVSGSDLADRAAELRPELKVLFTSGYPNHPMLARRPIGATEAFIEKPYRTANLATKIRNMLSN